MFIFNGFNAIGVKVLTVRKAAILKFENYEKRQFFQKGEQINVILRESQYDRRESTNEKRPFLRWKGIAFQKLGNINVFLQGF